MKNCQTVFPQTSGYLKYRQRRGGGNALIGRMAPNRGGRLLISFPEPEGFSNNKAKL